MSLSLKPSSVVCIGNFLMLRTLQTEDTVTFARRSFPNWFTNFLFFNFLKNFLIFLLLI